MDSTHLLLFVLSLSWLVFMASTSLGSLYSGRCSPCGAAGTLGLKWPISCYLASDCTGTPNSRVPGRCSPVAKLPLIHLSPNRGVRKPDLPPGVLGVHPMGSKLTRGPSGPLWKGLPRTAGVSSWPTAYLLPLLHPGMLVMKGDVQDSVPVEMTQPSLSHI